VAVADACYAVFSPAISAGTRVLVREKFPGSAARAVVFANRAPLALGEVWSPAFPIALSYFVIFQATVFGRLKSGHEWRLLQKFALPVWLQLRLQARAQTRQISPAAAGEPEFNLLQDADGDKCDSN